MQSIRPLAPLLTAAGILLAGNGVQGTLIAVRGAAEGFSPGLIGFIATAYFGGFLFGCLAITRILQNVGHIRAFSALAALASAAALMLAMAPNPVAWMAVRFISGFCFSGLFTTMESWLNSGVTNEARGRVLSLYRIIDIGAVTGAQYLIPAFGAEGFSIFSVMAMMIALSLVPVSLGDRSNPKPPEDIKLDLAGVWRISPIASIGCVAVGMTNSSFRMISPIFAQSAGFSVTDVATFISAGVIGGIVLQYPFGWMSDRWDRRYVLLIATSGAVVAALGIVFIAGNSLTANLIGVFAFGAFAMPLYSLSAAHANDHAVKGNYVQVAAGLMLFYSVGAMAGPPFAAQLMELAGPRSLFTFIAVVHALLFVATVWRMSVRPAVPQSERKRFTALLRTSPVFARLARRNSNGRH
ncbi:MAG: MFS transporter [Brucellaceae bacterium]|nr:MFS transporter [Brucellaceae bacterium]